MACIIYYDNLDYDKLPTSKKRPRSHQAGDECGSRVKQPCLQNIYESLNSDGFDEDPSIIYEKSFQSSRSSTSGFQSGSSSVDSNENTDPEPYNQLARDINRFRSDAPNGRCNNARPNRVATNGTNGHRTTRGGGAGRGQNTSRWNDDFSRSANDNDGCSNGGFVSAATVMSTGTDGRRQASYDNNSEEQQFVYEPPRITHDILVQTLKKYFGFDSFRTNQLEAVNATCQGLDTLVLMPTGGGKSICYQLPAVLSRGLTVVVSPLKSLICDQVDRLESLGIKTSALFGDTGGDEANEIYYDLNSMQPKHKLLYVTPEKITASGGLRNLFTSLYKRKMLARFTIDEAHCVSMWGSDFRPDYRKLGILRKLYPGVPIMALTATAPPKVRDDIYDQLSMDKQSGKTFIQSFNRPNLKFEVRIKSKGCIGEICNTIRNRFKKQCGIIYCLSRADCESTAETLREQGISSAPYHAGLADAQRKRVFGAWSSGVFQVVCATIAFGMGIDKSDVRFVIHYSVPKSVEGYYQEAGRAGRDGKFASCILYFSKSDLFRLRSMLKKGIGRNKEDRTRDQTNLDQIISYVENRNDCRRTILLAFLGEKFNRDDCAKHLEAACDNCVTRSSSF